MKKIQILVVEDESIVAKDLQHTLQNLEYSVPETVSTGPEAVKSVEKRKPDLVLMDIVLDGEMDGIEAAELIHSRFNVPVVYLTAHTDNKTVERAKITDPFGYIVKPFDDRQLKTVIEMALCKVEMHNKLKESEEWLFTTLRSIGDGVIATDKNGYIKFVNSVARKLTGCGEADVVGKPLNYIFTAVNEHTLEEIKCPVDKVIQGDVVVELSNHTILLCKDGRRIPINHSAAPIRDDNNNIIGVVLILRDIIDRKNAEGKLEESLGQKEMLLRELHHRVKNNMQVISSLLRLQTATLGDKKAVEIFKECQNRIKAMSLIHEKFYHSPDLSNIDFDTYVKDLIKTLTQSYGISQDKITLDVNIENVSLEINTAISCGMIINELISNSLKYAFPQAAKGNIGISILPAGGNQVEMIISDNGMGIPAELDFQKTDTLGLQLVNAFVKDQLAGEIELDRSMGTKFKIKFSKKGA
ncbi:MAG: histidine kinase dimerization/phosphoacceptor domain -containing protein [Sedimentisphaerales bacterium]